MMKGKTVFTCAAVFVAVITSSLYAEITITPTNVQIPEFAGQDLSFDFAISDISNPADVSAWIFKFSIHYVPNPGMLIFDEISSEAVANETEYWRYGYSTNATATDLGGSSVFLDNPGTPLVGAPLFVDDLVARYVFAWDGSPGDYTFTFDLNIDQQAPECYFIDAVFPYVELPLTFDPGVYPGDATSFTVTMPIPEPTTLILFALGGLVLRRKRR